MKKLLAIILATVMLFGLVACGNSENTNNANTTPDVESGTPTDTDPVTPPASSDNGTADTDPVTPPASSDTSEDIVLPEVDPVKYDFVKNFSNLEGTNFSFGIADANGIIESTTTWHQDDATLKNLASGQALTGYHTEGVGGQKVDVTLMGADIVWYTGWAANAGVSNLIIFTAPETGIYTYDFVTYSYWGCTHSSTAYRVEVGGQVHNDNSISYPIQSGKLDTLTTFKGTVELQAGETIIFLYDAEDDSSSDNSCIKKLEVNFYPEA